MDRDLKICLRCNQSAAKDNRNVPCWLYLLFTCGTAKYNEDFLSGKQMAGCDKLLEHGVSVNIDKIAGG